MIAHKVAVPMTLPLSRPQIDAGSGPIDGR
jgi:hypothetical protein